MDLQKFETLIEAAWEHAYPGREAAERNAILRELTPAALREKLAATLARSPAHVGVALTRRAARSSTRRTRVQVPEVL